MSNRRIIKTTVALNFEVDSNLNPEQLRELISVELNELAQTSGAAGAMLRSHEIRDIYPQEADQPFTVVFYIDGDHAVEHFTEEVFATSAAAAFNAAVEQAEASGCSSSGYSISSSEWASATEIATFAGHNLEAPYLSAPARAALSSQPAA